MLRRDTQNSAPINEELEILTNVRKSEVHYLTLSKTDECNICNKNGMFVRHKQRSNLLLNLLQIINSIFQTLC